MEPANGAIIPLNLSQLDEVIRLTKAVGWTVPKSKWTLYFEIGQSFGYVIDGVVVGCITHFKWDDGVSSIANVIVHPQYQRRGIGRALLSHVLKDAGHIVKLIATEAGEPLYTQLGFEPFEQVVRLQRIGALRMPSHDSPADEPPSTFRLPDTYSREISFTPMREVHPSIVKELVELDALQTGSHRVALFDALTRASSAWLLSINGETAKAICVIHDHVLSIGPIFSTTRTDVSRMLRAMTLAWDGEIRMDLSMTEQDWISCAESYDFFAHRTSPLMTLSSPEMARIPSTMPQIACFDAATT